MTDFKTLKVWQKAHVLALNVDRLAGQVRGFKHGPLRHQIIRAAMSIPANIAEGCRQESVKEYARFVRIALNSSTELEYHLIAARDLRVVPGRTCLTTSCMASCATFVLAWKVNRRKRSRLILAPPN